MMRSDYSNSMSRQAHLAPDIVKQMAQSMSFEKMLAALPLKELFDAQKIVITGCGDSWLAGIAAKPVFEHVAKMDTEVMRNIDFTRFWGAKNLGYSPNTPLVVAISISGGVSRVVEALRRANHYGANTILITNNRDSVAAKEAKYLIPLDLPEGEYQPGLNSYIGALMALFNLALRFARAKNTASTIEIDQMQQGLLNYADAFAAGMDEMDQRGFEIAQKWQNLRAIDFIGDYADYATAFFCSAKVAECYGGYTTYDDSEGWCHVNYFLRQPGSIGRVVTTNDDTPSYGRMKETLAAVQQLQSPCMVVTSGDKSEFAPEFEVFTTPRPSHFWMAPLLQHIPFDFVAGYIGALKGVETFRKDVAIFNHVNETRPNRIKESLIEIV